MPGVGGRKDNQAQLRNKNRSAHFSIGRENSPFQRETTTNQSYSFMGGEQQAGSTAAGAAVATGTAPTASHINIGSPSTKRVFFSEARHEYTPKEANKNIQNKEAMNNLAAHHYVFGTDKLKLRTTA